MPLNKLENFIKNTEGRILYVNPSDLDATDSVQNQGNSLSKPFRTIQRAIIEAARFSYIEGNDNDIVEKTTILLFPGEHIIDNRPGHAILKEDVGGTEVARAVPPGVTSNYPTAKIVFNLTPLTNFDLNQRDNVLHKFNSVYGGVIVPRGVSIVGLDLRKTKIRPTYVPNPTDPAVKNSAIFRVTGGCYFWQFSILDGDENKKVFTDPENFEIENKAVPTFSHHKLTAFEYADGVNLVQGFDQTDLDMYYNKLSNAYNAESNREINPKYPSTLYPQNFAKQRPEWEVVGAFASDPIGLEDIFSGKDGKVASDLVTVTTKVPHNFSVGTPIKIRGVSGGNDFSQFYNISSKVTSIDPTNPRKFTYNLTFRPKELPAGPDAGLSAANATVTIETDTVSGASPYIFNVSMRSTWGMNGLHADGAKASGFRSMVVAQFTAISLQKDDRAFVEYDPESRIYSGVPLTAEYTELLSSNSAQVIPDFVFHLNPNAIYRKGWQTSHIKMSNDAFVQIVSVFAIGFSKHFDARSGGDGSITNSNSNFGQLSLYAEGFKRESFDKDDKAFVTSIVAPRSVTNTEINIDWTPIDVGITTQVGITSHLYLFGYRNPDAPPPSITQGFRIGARQNDKLYIPVGTGSSSASIYMLNNAIGTGSTIALGTFSSEKNVLVSSVSNSVITTVTDHNLIKGEKIRILSDIGDLPENIKENTIYYAIPGTSTNLRVASSLTNALEGISIIIYRGSQLRVVSRVSDKSAGELGHPIQYDIINKSWFIHANVNNDIFSQVSISSPDPQKSVRTDVSFFKRIQDNRSLDEKLYKLRVVIPKSFSNARDPLKGYVIQESSSTNARSNSDFTSVPTVGITTSDYGYNRNPRFISSCTFNSTTKIITIRSDIPHNLKLNDTVIIRNVTSFDNESGIFNKGFNGTFTVNNVLNDKTFSYSWTDTSDVIHSSITTCTNAFNTRTISLPTFEKNNNQGNLFIYRSEVISPYIQDTQDGIYYLYVINSSNQIANEFTDLNYTQNIVDLYPQIDKDNVNDNPSSSITHAKISPLGDVVTNDLRNSITRESVDKFYKNFDLSPTITNISTPSSTSVVLTLSREHGFAGIATIASSDISGGSGYSNGTHYNVRLLNYGTTNWDGATANVVVSSGSIAGITVVSGGSGYVDGEVLQPDLPVVGTAATFRVRSTGIATFFNHVIQTTGIGTATDGYYRLTGVGNTTQITLTKGASDPVPTIGQYIINNGPIPIVGSYTTSFPGSSDAISGIATFRCNVPHGLVKGNRFRLTKVDGTNLGDYIVEERVGINTFTASGYFISPSDTPYYVLKHAHSANAATADVSQESLAARDVFFYDNDYLILSETITSEEGLFNTFKVSSGIATASRFPIGSYILVDNEIMRVKASSLTVDGKLQVIRGCLGSNKERHEQGSIIRKIKPIPIEFRRPSIIRASGHTFEYLGYGPGNYSTGLPQVQLKTLTEREDFLAQSQETSCGSVVYTGMNSEGDFFIGNTKYSATSGEQTTFDIPTPTVTGQETSNLNVVYDEVIVKERLLVEGGNSGNILSQFDGPVTFTQDVQINGALTLGSIIKSAKEIKIDNVTDSTSPITGALIIAGGLGIGRSTSVGGNLRVSGLTTCANETNSTKTNNGSLVVNGGVGIAKNLNVGFGVSVSQNLAVVGFSTFLSNIKLPDNKKLLVGDSDTFDSGDLEIYHNTTESFIDEKGTGNLHIRSNSNVVVSSYSSSGIGSTVARFTQSTAELYYTNGTDTKLILETTGIGVTVHGRIYADDDIIAFSTSDERLKDNIKPIEDPLAKVLSISGNTFDWNDKSQQNGVDVGVIAQEIQKVLPEAVTERENGYLAVRYEKLVPLLIEAIKELKSEIDELKNQK